MKIRGFGCGVYFRCSQLLTFLSTINKNKVVTAFCDGAEGPGGVTDLAVLTWAGAVTDHNCLHHN